MWIKEPRLKCEMCSERAISIVRMLCTTDQAHAKRYRVHFCSAECADRWEDQHTIPNVEML